jgi:hypothetical protein
MNMLKVTPVNRKKVKGCIIKVFLEKTVNVVFCGVRALYRVFK